MDEQTRLRKYHKNNNIEYEEKKMEPKTLEEIYKETTGKEAKILTTDGVHCVGIKVYAGDYVKWLENLIEEKNVEIEDFKDQIVDWMEKDEF